MSVFALGTLVGILVIVGVIVVVIAVLGGLWGVIQGATSRTRGGVGTPREDHAAGRAGRVRPGRPVDKD